MHSHSLLFVFGTLIGYPNIINLSQKSNMESINHALWCTFQGHFLCLSEICHFFYFMIYLSPLLDQYENFIVFSEKCSWKCVATMCALCFC